MRINNLRFYFIGFILSLTSGFIQMAYAEVKQHVLHEADIAQDNYKYIDENGKTIALPEDEFYFSQENPGPLKAVLAKHEPFIKNWVRKEGLEDINVLQITIPHPLGTEDSEMGRIEAVYVTDKDNLMIGYRAFDEEEPLTTKILFNGIINFVHVYVVCSKHGTWKFDYKL